MEFDGEIIELLSKEILKVVNEQGVIANTRLRERVIAEIMRNWDCAMVNLAVNEKIQEDNGRTRQPRNRL
jgi:hypothetical protein